MRYKDYARRQARLCLRLLPILLFIVAAAGEGAAQRRRNDEITLWGDFKVDESRVPGLKPQTFHLVLKDSTGSIVSEQTITDGGRYRFLGLGIGEYNVVVEMDGQEVARVHVLLSGPQKTDIRQDIMLEWRGGNVPARAGTVSADNIYGRPAPNQALYDRAVAAAKKKSYDEAVRLLRQIVAEDPKDFEAWTELGTQQFNAGDPAEAEKSFLRAAQERPTFVLPFLNLGKLRLARKDYEGAVEALTKAVALAPPSAEANYQLGEAYLQLRKGSKAVPYFTEAIRLGMAEGHLRLAALYNAAGLKDRAAAEYEQFLSKNPGHPDRKKLEQYIKENGKK